MAEALHYELLGFDEEILKVEEQLRERRRSCSASVSSALLPSNGSGS